MYCGVQMWQLILMFYILDLLIFIHSNKLAEWSATENAANTFLHNVYLYNGATSWESWDKMHFIK